MVWPTLDKGSLTHWQTVQAQGHPVVFGDRYDDALACNFVGVDNYMAAKEAVRYLLRLGHLRIAHLTSDEQISTVVERAAGYRDALRNSVMLGATETIWTVPRAPHDRIEAFVEHCIQAADPPTPVFAIERIRSARVHRADGGPRQARPAGRERDRL